MSAVRFILGRSGTGKTQACVEWVRAALAEAPEGPPLILLVPEQATFQVERGLIEAPPEGQGGMGPESGQTGRAGGPAGSPGTSPGSSRGGRAGGPAGSPGNSPGSSRGNRAGGPAGSPVGYHRARVLSFRRFAHLVFNEVGGPADPPISALAKQMALRAVLGPMRDRLTTFAASLDRPGFLARLADTFREFHQYQVTASMLRERADAEPRERLRRKLVELADAFDAFNGYLREARFTDPDAALTEAAGRLARSALAAGASVWVDGFAGFTPQELAFLGDLAAVAERVEIALVIDPGDLPRSPAAGRAPDVPAGRLFRRTEQTFIRLRRLFAEKGVKVDRPLVLDQVRRFETAPVLATLERDLFSSDTGVGVSSARRPLAVSRADQPPEPSLLAHRDDELLLVEAPDRRAEVRAAANHVRRLVARFGYRYRDVAVILRSLDEYWPFIVEAFEDAGVPFFIDRRQPISHHPLVELLRSAVGTVSRRLSAADVIAYLKTDLPAAAVASGDGPNGGPADVRDAVDRLENYALAYGLAGPAWFQPHAWRFHESTAFGQEDLGDLPPPPGFEQMAAVAEQALAPLAELHQFVSDAGGSPTVARWAAALWRLMARLDVEGMLAVWATDGSPGGDARIHRYAFDSAVGLLGDLARALGEVAMNGGQFAEVLEAGLSQLTLGLVPPALDQVLVGAIERSRHPRIKAALVLGMAERSFPRARPVQTILTDEDRQELAGKDVTGQPGGQFPFPQTTAEMGTVPFPIELAPGRGEALFDEDLMAYLALTRPAERLWVSWPAADEDGRPVNPSRYVRRLRERFADLPLIRLAEQPPALAAVTGGELAGCLAGQFATGGDAWRATLRRGREGDGPDEAGPSGAGPPPLAAGLYDLARGAAPAELARAMASLGYANEPALSGELAGSLHAAGGVVGGSVTRLESFAACPFKHFADFGLRLRPREQIELDALQLGSFYHELLRQLFERLGPGPVDWSARPPGELRRIVGELVASARDQLALPRLSGGAAAYVLAQAEQVLGDLAEAMHASAAASAGVRQAAAELVFGGPDGELAALKLPLGGGAALRVRGKIDRVDLAADGGVFVIDYKTGHNALNWSAVHHGLSVQLPAYLLAIHQNADVLLRLLTEPRAEARGRPAQRAAPPLPKKLHPAGAFFQRIAVRPSSASPPPSGGGEPDPRDLLAPYQRHGVFLADAARALDTALEAGGSSPFVRFKLKRDGEPAAIGNDSVTQAELADLMAWSAGRMEESARAILAGETGVRPYRLGSGSPCSWCDFRAVCRLDFDYNRPRYLPVRQRGEVLAELAGHVDQEESDKAAKGAK